MDRTVKEREALRKIWRVGLGGVRDQSCLSLTLRIRERGRCGEGI